MKLMSVSNVSFKANYYKVSKYGASTTVDIMTDNAENLGLKPVCESKYDYIVQIN